MIFYDDSLALDYVKRVLKVGETMDPMGKVEPHVGMRALSYRIINCGNEEDMSVRISLTMDLYALQANYNLAWLNLIHNHLIMLNAWLINEQIWVD